MVDNEDVYGYNQNDGDTPNLGEDVIDDGFDPNTGKNKPGSLQLDNCELPSPAALTPPSTDGRPPGVSDASVAASTIESPP